MSAPPSTRTVLVTGAAKRLGREIALHLAASGWQVAVHYRGSADEARQTVADCSAHGPRAAAFQADLADERTARDLVRAVVATFGSLDAVVNSASVFEHDTAADADQPRLLRHFTANTVAPVVLAQELHRHLEQRDGHGAVVNLLDQKLWNLNPDFFSYTLSKAALETATTLLAQTLAPRLRIVGVAPGLTITSSYLEQQKFEELHKLSPLGRSSTPQDVAATVRFALENASITGTTLLVDGGQHLVRFARDFSFM